MKSRQLSLERLESRQLLAAVTWTALGDAVTWNDPLNWSGQAVPTLSDDVTIAAGIIGISIGQDHAMAHSLIAQAPLWVGSDGVIEVATNADLKAPLSLEGELRGGTYRYAGQALAGPGEIDVLGTTAKLTGNPTLQAPVLVNGSNLYIQSDVMLDDYLYLASGASSLLMFNGPQATTLRGTGVIEVTGGGSHHIRNDISYGATQRRVTLEVAFHVQGAGLSFGYAYHSSFPCDFDLKSTIDVEFGGVCLNDTGQGGQFHNNGSISAGEGAELLAYGLVNETGHSVNVIGSDYVRASFSLGRDWSNAGTIRVRDSDVYIHDYCSSSQWESITLEGYSPVTIDGTIDNSGHALVLNDSTGGYTMAQGYSSVARLVGGSLTLVGPNALRIHGGTFDDVTLNSDLTLAGQWLHIENRLVLNATISMSSSASVTSIISCGRLFDSGVVIDGSGTIRSTGNLRSVISAQSSWDHALRIGSGITIEGRNLEVTGYSSSSGQTKVINEGTIRLLNAGDVISVDSVLPLENYGEIEVGSGAQLNIYVLTNELAHLVRVHDGGLLWSVWYQNQGTIDLDGTMVIDWDPNYGGLSPYEQVKAQVVSGRNGGAWNGIGICSTLAQTDPNRTVGYAEASQVLAPGGGTFAGMNVDGSTVLIRGTIRGDLDLDRTIAFGDLLRLAQNYGMAGRTYDQGDVNFDGTVNFDDLLPLAQNYGQTVSTNLVDASVLPLSAHDVRGRSRNVASIQV